MTPVHDHDEHPNVTIETLRAPPRQAGPASLVRRAVATVIDSLILLGIWSAGALATGANPVSYLAASSLLLPGMILGGYLGVIGFFYYALMEGIFAGTLGKLALKLRVTTLEGDPCSLRSAVTRNLVRFVDWLPTLYIVGVASMSLSSKRQRLGDRLAKTVVSSAPEKDINPPPAPFLFH